MLQIILLVATTQLGRLKTEDVAVVAVGGGTRSGSRLLKTEDEWKITAAAKGGEGGLGLDRRRDRRPRRRRTTLCVESRRRRRRHAPTRALTRRRVDGELTEKGRA